MKRIRGALIGCGHFAGNHINGWNEIPDVKIAAVCDIDASRAEAFAEKYNVKSAYTDAADMLRREQPDFVDIITQPDSHSDLVETAAAYKSNVICQKPLAPSLEDAEKMVRICE